MTQTALDGIQKFASLGVALLALTTPMVYALAFAFEAGYLGFFGVPAEFVHVDVKRFLVFGAALAGLYTAYTWINLGVLFLPRKMTPGVRWLVHTIFILVASSGVVAWIGDASAVGILGTIAATLLITAFVLGPPIAFNWKDNSLEASIVEMKAADSGAERDLFGIVARAAGSPWVPSAIVIFCVAIFVANQLGEREARHQEVFMLVDTAARCVVLRATDSEVLCATLSHDADRLDGSFKVVPTSGLSFTRVQLGRLRVPELPLVPDVTGDEAVGPQGNTSDAHDRPAGESRGDQANAQRRP